MTEQQSALTRLLDWAAGQVAVMRASYSADEDGRIYDEEIREEVEQVEADMAALNGLEERISKLECDLGSALVRAESAEQRLAEVREENRGLRQDTLILEKRGDRLDVALEAIELFCQERRAVLSDATSAPTGEGSGGGADHSRDFEGSDPRGMGPLPGEPGNPNPSFEQMENDATPQRLNVLEALELLVLKAGNKDCREEYSAVYRALSDHEALKQAYGAAVMELKRLGATSVPLFEPAVPQHPDDAAVDRFAIAMKAKLKWEREERGRGGWDDPEQCSDSYLATLLVDHIRKGNPGTFEDVANFAMMLHQRGAIPTTLAEAANSEPAVPSVPDVEAIRDVIILLEQSAGPFDEACRLLRAAVPEPDGEKEG